VNNLNYTLPQITISDSPIFSLENGNFGKTPSTNRGSERETVSSGYSLTEDFGSRVDWFQGTFPLESLERLSEIKNLVMLEGDQVLQEGDPWHSGKRWDHHGFSAYGLMWAWDDPAEGKPGKGWLCIKGSYLSYMAPEAVQCLMRILILEYGVKTTRLDFALDDYSKTVTPYQVLQHGFAREFGRFRRAPRFSGDAHDGSLTVTFGSRAADKLLRIYDKAKESNGEIDAIRWEVEFKDEVAHAYATQFIECSWDELPYLFVGQSVLGVIEFCKPQEGQKRFCSYCLLEWWQAFKAKLGSVRLPVPRKPQTLERRKEWMRAAWSKTLAGMSLLFGGEVTIRDMIRELIRSGLDRLTGADLNLFKVWEYEYKLALTG
jgi:hypothetical protein